MSNDSMQDLKDSMIRMEFSINRMSDKQDEISSDIKDVKSAIYHPETGLYARIKELEQWKAGVSRFIWSFGLSIAALVANAIFDLI